MEWTFEVDGPVDADLVVPAGRVDITAGDRVQVVIEADGGSARGEEVVKAAEVKCSGGRLRVHVPTKRFRSVEVDCRIVMPAGSRLQAKTASADVNGALRLTGFDAATASGHMQLEDVDGDVSFASASGDLTAGAVAGRLRGRTASGDLTVRRVGGEVDIALASGEVEIGDAGGSVKVKSASGDIRVGSAHEGKVRIETASGDIAVGVASGVGAYLDIESMSGDMRCDVPVQDRSAGEASLELVCRSASGDVEVRGAAA